MKIHPELELAVGRTKLPASQLVGMFQNLQVSEIARQGGQWLEVIGRTWHVSGGTNQRLIEPTPNVLVSTLQEVRGHLEPFVPAGKVWSVVPYILEKMRESTFLREWPRRCRREIHGP